MRESLLRQVQYRSGRRVHTMQVACIIIGSQDDPYIEVPASLPWIGRDTAIGVSDAEILNLTF